MNSTFGTWKSLTAVAVMAVGLSAFTGCSSDDSGTPATKPNPTGTGEVATKKIDNSTGGVVQLSGGTAVDVPPGALPPGVETITVESSTTPAPSEYAAQSPVYVFGPDGTVFLKPLKVTIPVSFPAGTNKADMTVLWSRLAGQEGFDMVASEFTAVPGSTTDFLASGMVTHFSKGFCGRKFTKDPNPTPDPYAK